MVNSLHDLLERLQPSLSILQNPDSIDRTAKRLAIRNLREIGLNQLKDSETAREFLQNTHSILLACIRDDRVEKCREQCLEFTYDVFSNSSDTGFALEATLELCKKRVLVTAKMREPEEEAEEIRLGIVRLLNLILSKSSVNDIKPAIADDVLHVIQGCITDRFPDVQKEACAVLLTITERKSSYLGYFGDKITKALLPILRHKHAVLRTLGIQVVESLVVTSFVGLKPLIEVTEDYDKSIMETLSYDNSPAVRDALARCTSTWLTTCSPMDRYRFADSLLPLLLTAAVDDIETVRQRGQKGLGDVDNVCLKDMEDAGILAHMNNVNGTSSIGLANLVHHTFKRSLQSISHMLCIPFNQQRTLSLKALQLLLKLALQEDIILHLKSIITTIATVRELEAASTEVMNQVADVIDITSKKVPKSSFYLDILIRLISNVPDADKRINSSTAIWILDRFVEYTADDAISIAELSRILDLLKSPAMAKTLMSETDYIDNACNIWRYAIFHYTGANHELLDESNLCKIVMAALQLLALCSVTDGFLESGSLQGNTVSIGTIDGKKRQIEDTVVTLHGPSQKSEDVFAHYLPLFLETITKPRGNEPEKWNDESLSLRSLQIIVMESGRQVFGNNSTIDKIISILIRCGSQQHDNRRDIDCSRISARIRCLVIMAWLYNMDKETSFIATHSNAILKDLILQCIELSEPQNGAGTLSLQNKLRQQAIVCLTTAMECHSMKANDEFQEIIQDIMIKYLQNEDERTRELSVFAMVAFIKRSESETKLSTENEKLCLEQLLSRSKDEKKTVYISLYNCLPAILGIISSDGRQLAICTLVSQIEFVYAVPDTQLKVAFKACLNILCSLESSRLIDAIKNAQQISTEPKAYQYHIDILSNVYNV